MKKTIIFLLLTFTVSSCVTSFQEDNSKKIEEARSYWVGSTKQSLMLSWGPPFSKTSDGNGGEIYTYRRYNGYITWVTNFYINNDEIIYHLNANTD